MANLVHGRHTETTRTTIDHTTVPDHTPKAVGDRLHVHQAVTTAQAHTPRDLATAKAMAKTQIDLTIPKAKVKLGMASDVQLQNHVTGPTIKVDWYPNH